jgi:uncharacterized protein YjbJ (UPF0337 family)
VSSKTSRATYKEVIGRVTGRRVVEAEGEAQKKKASSKRDAEAKAEAARSRATKNEAEQRLRQERLD